MRSLMVLYLVLDRLGVDLLQRLEAGQLIYQWEVEEVMRQCWMGIKQLVEEDETADGQSSTNVVTHTNLNKTLKVNETLTRKSYGIRLIYIRDYLDWLVPNWIGRMRRTADPLADQLEAEKKRVSAALATKIPHRKSRVTLYRREGLSKEAKARLLQIIAPNSPDNPWVSAHTKSRNSLIVKFLLKLGCRRGELLGLRTQDVDLATGMVKIVRKADDKADPRKHQPLTKTHDREVALGEELTALLRQYIRYHRNAIKGARKHGFLFVSNGTGAPLTLDGIAKVFAVIRSKCPDLPRDLSPHILRHTWNDDFSEYADRAKLSDEEEMRLRNYSMGWSPASESSQYYLRRHTREAANKASLGMQNELIKKRVK